MERRTILNVVVELNFGGYFPGFARADNNNTDTQPDEKRRIMFANPDDSDLKTIVNKGRKLPDGFVLDGDARLDDAVTRANFDGTEIETLVDGDWRKWRVGVATDADVGKF